MSLGDDVLRTVKPYLGVASRDFTTRIAKRWCSVEIESITPAHLPTLSYWMRIGAAKIVGAQKSEELGKAIDALAATR